MKWPPLALPPGGWWCNEEYATKVAAEADVGGTGCGRWCAEFWVTLPWIFGSYPPDKWALLLSMMLPMADHLEVCRSFAKSRLPAALQDSEVALAAGLTRIYCATHRFQLTADARGFVSAKAYLDWDTGHADECEDPALFKGNELLLGTISHEDIVVLLLSESEQQHINSLGFDFWCEWRPE